MVGFLSSMISNQYNHLTAKEGYVRHLHPKNQPRDLGIVIPEGFYDEGLKLWQLILQPSLDDFIDDESG